jgi:hypothetical protein
MLKELMGQTDCQITNNESGAFHFPGNIEITLSYGRKFTSVNLHEIGLKHRTDKATYHQYLNFYENFINPVKVSRFLEIGILLEIPCGCGENFFLIPPLLKVGTLMSLKKSRTAT